MTKILSPLVVGYLNNGNYAYLHEPFGFISDVLAAYGMKGSWRPIERTDSQVLGEVWGPAGFVFDFESTPDSIRGPLGVNKRGGTAHDISCRIGACPGITKSIAADVYFEIMEYCDSIDYERFDAGKHKVLPSFLIEPYVEVRDWLRRWIKSTTVRIWPGDYFQKYTLTATAKEIYGIDSDPYCIIEKIEAAITQSEQATEAIKEMPAVVADKTELVDKSKKVTEELKDMKADVEVSITP